MRKRILIGIATAAFLFFAGWVWAQEPIIFPAQGQSPEQTEKDKCECYAWATQQAGFDPMQAPQTVQAPPPQSQGPSGQRVKGAARGAVIGGVVGEVADDDAGKGAAAGAAAGVVAGGMKTRQGRRQQASQQEEASQQQAATDEARNTFNRAFGACMEGKGYTVK
jgi:hypothetical protein